MNAPGVERPERPTEPPPTPPVSRPRPGSSLPPSLIYDLPMRGGSFMARLTLPTDMTADDAQRIARFVHALVLDDVADLGGGPR